MTTRLTHLAFKLAAIPATARSIAGMAGIVAACLGVSSPVDAAPGNGHMLPASSADRGDSVQTIAPPNSSERASTRPANRIRLNGSLTESYDNNILNYSDNDRALFESAFVPAGRFGISRLDDQITEFGLRLAYESGKRRDAWRVRLKFDATMFAHNTFRHYSEWGMEIRRTIRRSYAEASFSWLPDYNLRNLYWRPMANRPFGVRYTPANFGRLSYDLELGTELSNRLDVRVGLGLGLSNYHYPFDERDNHTFSEIARMIYTAGRRISLSGTLGLGQSRAAGRDSVNAIVKDVSYNALIAGCGVRYKLDRRGRAVASGNVDYQHQTFLSKKPLDTSHYHRLDDDYEFNLSLSCRIAGYFQPELSYVYRMTRSTVVTSAADFGSYTAHRLGLQVSAYF